MHTGRNEVERIVIKIVRDIEELPDDRVILSTTDFRADLGTDSLFDAEFGMAVEERFEIEVPDSARPKTIGEAVDMILAAQAATSCGA